jgi:hypothetical protein
MEGRMGPPMFLGCMPMTNRLNGGGAIGLVCWRKTAWALRTPWSPARSRCLPSFAMRIDVPAAWCAVGSTEQAAEVAHH